MIAISGGMVASFALPASAATVTPEVKTAATEALAAPTTPLASPSFGNIDFTGIAKPAPAVVAPRSAQTVSRSATRAPVAVTAAPAAPSDGLLGIAASLAGIPYAYGGTTPAGFDCSGYTRYVFAQLGISLPRTAEAQREFATPVSSPQPGDLVFFGVPAHHVGIYAGNGMMWDSPTSGRAVALRSIWSESATFGRVS